MTCAVSVVPSLLENRNLFSIPIFSLHFSRSYVVYIYINCCCWRPAFRIWINLLAEYNSTFFFQPNPTYSCFTEKMQKQVRKLLWANMAFHESDKTWQREPPSSGLKKIIVTEWKSNLCHAKPCQTQTRRKW